MINKKIIFLVLLLLLAKTAIAQIDKSVDYIIISFESIKKHPNVTQTYYWITPIDSIGKKAIIDICPLYTEEYSNDCYEKCIKGDTVDVFTTTTVTNFNFTKEYLTQLEYFNSILKQKRKLVQSVELTWNIKVKENEKLNIYITPIRGEFCSCIQLSGVWGKPYLDFLAQVFMPVNSFSYIENFWQTELGKTIQIIDFSRVDFAGHIPLDVYGMSVLKARIAIKPISLKLKK